jgi:hypothetical protein
VVVAGVIFGWKVLRRGAGGATKATLAIVRVLALNLTTLFLVFVIFALPDSHAKAHSAVATALVTPLCAAVLAALLWVYFIMLRCTYRWISSALNDAGQG